ncbi:MAG: TetR/AcrR family transcriptional regulator [Acidimicrobiia bacterium]|nr:TetR/AcrR family transcriptional regulator [Acidimicrobiia bacterium]
MGTRERYHHGQLRDELIDIAEALIVDSGPQSWSMREAARRLGVSQAAPYRHFANKDALIDAVVLRGYSQLEHHYIEALRTCPADGDRLIVIAMAYFRFAIDRPELFTLMFSSPRLHATAEAVHSYGVFEGEIVAAQSRGDLPVGSAQEHAHVLWAAAHGIAELVNREVFSRRRGTKIANILIASAVHGLSAGERPARYA